MKRPDFIKLITEKINFEYNFQKRLDEIRIPMRENDDKPSWWPQDIEFPKWDSEDNSVKKWELKNMLKHIQNIATEIKLMDAGSPKANKITMMVGKKLIKIGVPALVKQDMQELEKLDKFLKTMIENWSNVKGYSKLATRLYPISAFLRDKYNTGQGAGNDVQSKRTRSRDDQPTAASPSRSNQATPVTRVNEGKNET